MAGNHGAERKGIAAVMSRVSDLEQIWRESSNSDFGIDGHIEFLDDNEEPTGMLVGVQVKSGPSYFKNENDLGVPYYANEKHQKYWEHYPVPVLLVLHHTERKETIWVDARQEFRTGKAPENKIVVPKANDFMASTVDELFKNVGQTQTEYVKDISALLEVMLSRQTGNATFDISFFDLFCLGMTNICRSLYFGMDLAVKTAENKLAMLGSTLGVSLGGPEYDFIEDYIRFLVSQNLVHANYSDLLIDLEMREMVPEFIVPLSRRGNALKELISNREDELVAEGWLAEDRARAAQEAFVEMVDISMGSRFERVRDVAAALSTKPE